MNIKTMKAMGLGPAVALGVLLSSAAAAGTVTYFHNDLAGSPVAATNESGQVIWRESYRPYGERTINSAAASGNKVWFTSRRQDVETGLVYMGARYYDPVVGRFMSTDPAGFDEKNLHSFNRYAYANNNPYAYVDPDGKSAAHILRGVAQGSFWAATRLGAKEVGERLGLALWVLLNSDTNSAGESAKDGGGEVHDVVVPSDKYPESARHIQDAQDGGHPDVLTIDRGGAKGRRTEAMKGHDTTPGKDRDEYPPAMFGEGGKGASVRPISPSDNRGAGACIGAQCSGLADGSRVRIVPD